MNRPSQAGKPVNPTTGDTGSAARFFNQFADGPDADAIVYHAKAAKADRAGSKHPTVKPVDLMAYLIKLVTPPGGTVLDPFGGAGTTALVADRMGLDCTIIELNPEYAEIARKRITGEQGMFANVTVANDLTKAEAA